MITREIINNFFNRSNIIYENETELLPKYVALNTELRKLVFLPTSSIQFNSKSNNILFFDDSIKY
jgi:hypothetical protein